MENDAEFYELLLAEITDEEETNEKTEDVDSDADEEDSDAGEDETEAEGGDIDEGT